MPPPLAAPPMRHGWGFPVGGLREGLQGVL